MLEHAESCASSSTHDSIMAERHVAQPIGQTLTVVPARCGKVGEGTALERLAGRAPTSDDRAAAHKLGTRKWVVIKVQEPHRRILACAHGIVALVARERVRKTELHVALTAAEPHVTKKDAAKRHAIFALRCGDVERQRAGCARRQKGLPAAVSGSDSRLQLAVRDRHNYGRVCSRIAVNGAGGVALEHHVVAEHGSEAEWHVHERQVPVIRPFVHERHVRAVDLHHARVGSRLARVDAHRLVELIHKAPVGARVAAAPHCQVASTRPGATVAPVGTNPIGRGGEQQVACADAYHRPLH
eukprot:5042348-Prymnesium_polylepis.3